MRPVKGGTKPTYNYTLFYGIVNDTYYYEQSSLYTKVQYQQLRQYSLLG